MGTLAWLSDLVNQLRAVHPVTASADAMRPLRPMRDAAMRAERQALTNGDAHTFSAQGMINGALNNALAARDYKIPERSLLYLPSDTNPLRADMAMATSRGAEPGLPQGASYIELLGSMKPGAGRAALQHLADQYPDDPIYLHSLLDPDTLDFYAKRGFQSVPDPYNSQLPLFMLPQGRQLKARGGGVRPSPLPRVTVAATRPPRLEGPLAVLRRSLDASRP